MLMHPNALKRGPSLQGFPFLRNSERDARIVGVHALELPKDWRPGCEIGALRMPLALAANSVVLEDPHDLTPFVRVDPSAHSGIQPSVV
jgi:hypothetical protein